MLIALLRMTYGNFLKAGRLLNILVNYLPLSLMWSFAFLA